MGLEPTTLSLGSPKIGRRGRYPYVTKPFCEPRREQTRGDARVADANPMRIPRTACCPYCRQDSHCEADARGSAWQADAPAARLYESGFCVVLIVNKTNENPRKLAVFSSR